MVRAILPTTISLQFSVQGDHYIVYADPNEIQRILLNLSTYAVYAMCQSGGSLKIHVEHCVIKEERSHRLSTLNPGSYVRLTCRTADPAYPLKS